MLRLGAKFVLSFAWRCPSHFLLVSLCSSFLSSPKSPALCRAVTCGLVLSVPDLAGASSCLSFLFPEGLFQSRAELASGVVRSPPPPPAVSSWPLQWAVYTHTWLWNLPPSWKAHPRQQPLMEFLLPALPAGRWMNNEQWFGQVCLCAGSPPV